MNPIPSKRYRPEFTQLPYGFLNDNTALQTLIRTKGLQYLAMYIAIQDRMANHTEEDFTLSREEAIGESKANLQLYSTSDEEIGKWFQDLVDANLIESRVFVNPFTDREEERYCIPAVAETLELLREAWFTKVINPLKIPKPDKDQLKSVQEEVNKVKKEIRIINAKKQNYRRELSRELDKENVDKTVAKVLNELIADCDRDVAMLYRKMHSIENSIKLPQGGELANEE